VLDGNTIVDGTFTITDKMIAPNAEIDGAKIADATIGSAKIASLDVDKISGNRTEFIQSWWNNINTQTSIDDRGINIYGSDQWRATQIQETGFRLYNGSSASNKAGAIGYFKSNNSNSNRDEEDVMYTDTDRHSIVIAVNSNHLLTLGYNSSTGNFRGYTPVFRVDPLQRGQIWIGAEMNFDGGSNSIT